MGALHFGCDKFISQGGALMMFKGTLVVMKASKIRNTYKLDGSTSINQAAMTSEVAARSTHLWHQRLGHMSEKGLQGLFEC